MEYSKFIVIFIILINCLFASAVLLVFAKTGSEPTALVAAWFAWTTGELWSLSKITRDKHKSKRGEKE